MTQNIVERSIEQAYLKGIEDAKKSADCVKCEDDIRAEVIDEFLDKAKERINGFMMAELQGEDMCPFSEIGDGECQYMNQDICCSYCARKADIEELGQIAEELKEQKE